LVQKATVITDTKKSSIDDEEYDENDIIGPKFRRPSGPIHPKVIFLRERRDKTEMSRGFARLYQDMIRYSILDEYRDILQKQKQQGQPEGFKVSNIGRWLLRHNPDFIDYYSGSKSKVRLWYPFCSGLTG
jgi:hypothetical protein